MLSEHRKTFRFLTENRIKNPRSPSPLCHAYTDYATLVPYKMPICKTLFTNNNRNRYTGLEICEYEIILFLLISSCLHYNKLCQQMHIKLMKHWNFSIYAMSPTCWWMAVCIQTPGAELCDAGRIWFCECVCNITLYRRSADCFI
jgi:hypothetical protein